MADGKRGSIAGKIATPKVGVGAGKEVNLDGDSILYKAVGARVKITCAPHNNVLEGTLFTTCNVTNAIAINTAPPPPNPSASLASQPGDYHIIPFAHILSFEIIGPGERAAEAGPGFDGALPSISKVDLDALRAREEQTIREMKKKDLQKGKGVTKEAQDIFDTIARTLPTRWNGTEIIVNDAVIIESPYAIENARAATGKDQSLAHIKKIMESYYQRKKTTAPSNRPAVATPIAPRKGG
ncbi:anticodon-binding domain-containing protein [Lophiotrema nucula]|uniref:Anticodon-binding domain-containing protein n=1 Tax=Lophiotrema nucula TaxID=690887 RepID=A0A6A5YH80_9PLEO|nr:anticodon-binding domain-containing protein [Lophiotrema nucula]